MRNKMGPLFLVSFLFVLMASKAFASDEILNGDVHKLPYWIQDSLLQYADEINNRNLGWPIRQIYRKDLDPNYAAYYEFQFDDWAMTFSTGPKTGDHRLVDEKQIPRITDILIKQAAKVNKTCFKFFRLTPDGTTICEDVSGKAVASTMDLRTLTTNINLSELDKEIGESLTDFKEVWNALAQKIRSSNEWKEITIYDWNKIPPTVQKTMVYKVLTPGESQDIPIGTFNTSQVAIKVGVEEIKKTLKTLCFLLGDICSKTGEVKVSRIVTNKKNLKNLNFIKIDVTDDEERLVKKLKKRSIDFYLKLTVERKFVVIRRYTIDLSHKQNKRSDWSGFTTYSIPHERLMPDYDQHKCCGGCYSGSTPVAWAQVFAYYDRVAHSYGSRYSIKHWRGTYGITGDPSQQAPGHLNWKVKRYVKALRNQLGTFCSNGQGSTYNSRTADVDGWFRQRQGSGRVITISSSDRIKKISDYIKQGYPVVNNFWYRGSYGRRKEKSSHTVVITKVKERSRGYKTCRKVGWFFWRRTKCNWNTEYDYEWYRRMGWGGRENGWITGTYDISSFGAFVAVV